MSDTEQNRIQPVVMGNFCKQCSEEVRGEDTGDLRGLGLGMTLGKGNGWPAYCKGCGLTVVDDKGVCLSVSCGKGHNKDINQPEPCGQQNPVDDGGRRFMQLVGWEVGDVCRHDDCEGVLEFTNRSCESIVCPVCSRGFKSS